MSPEQILAGFLKQQLETNEHLEARIVQLELESATHKEVQMIIAELLRQMTGQSWEGLLKERCPEELKNGGKLV